MLEEAIRRLKALVRPAPPVHHSALVLSGGGARAAFQAGVLSYVADAFPEARFSILTGVSAGAINAAHLANHPGPFEAATGELAAHWKQTTTDRVFEATSGLGLLWSLVRRWNDDSPAAEGNPNYDTRGLVDTTPLRALLQEQFKTPDSGVLHGVADNFRRGRLRALALLTTNYATGQTVSFVQGENVGLWERPNRISVNTTMTVDHVMASTSLPLLFPAVQIGDAWYGDGGIRLSAPLAPAIHLGADRIMVVSTRYPRSRAEADEPATIGYPPVAQILSILMNAVFLDMLDQDARMLELINRLVEDLPKRKRHGLRPIRFLEIRPSVDLGRLSRRYEATLPGPLRILSRALGTEETQSPDWLSVLLFEEEYLARLVELGYDDARRQHDALATFFALQ